LRAVAAKFDRVKMRYATATIWTMKPMNQFGRRKGRSHFSSLLTISDGNMIMELFSAIKKNIREI